MQRFRTILNSIFASVLIMMLISVVCINENSNYHKYDFNENLSDGWMITKPDTSLSEIQFPYQFHAGNNHIRLVRTLPEVEDHTVLLVKCNYQSITAFVDGEEIYHSLPATFGMVKTDLGHYFAMIPLKADHSGKDIVLHIEERESGYNSDIKYIRLTTASQFGFQLFESNPLRFVIATIILICAAASLIAWVVLCSWNSLIPEERYHPFLWVCLFAASIGVWFLSEPHVWAIATGSFAASGIMNYLALSLMPVSLLGILKSICAERLASLRWIVIIAKVILIAEWLLFLTGVMDLSTMLLPFQLACIIAMAIFALYIVLKQDLFLVGPAIRYGVWAVLAMVILTVIAYLNGGDWTPWALTAAVIILLSISVSTLLNVIQAMKDISQTKQYKEYALTDIMTGLKSRYAYTIFEAQQKVGLPSPDLTLVYLDIDKLKIANDTLGHVAGDELIIAASKCIHEAFGNKGQCFRMGGDEFLVAMTVKPEIVWASVALFDQLVSRWTGKYVDTLTISYGVVAAKEYPDQTFEELIRTADDLMYQHKRQQTGCP